MKFQIVLKSGRNAGISVWGPKGSTLKGNKVPLFYVCYFLLNINWLDTFGTDYVHMYQHHSVHHKSHRNWHGIEHRPSTMRLTWEKFTTQNHWQWTLNSGTVSEGFTTLHKCKGLLHHNTISNNVQNTSSRSHKINTPVL
jgi:hypothetical protein